MSKLKSLIIIPEITVPPVKIGYVFVKIPYHFYIKNCENFDINVLTLLLFSIQNQPIEDKLHWLYMLESLNQVLDKNNAIKLVETLPSFAKRSGFLDDEYIANNLTIQ